MSEEKNGIVIVDYGMGNLGSVKNMFKKIGYETVVSSNPSDVTDAEKIVLPGVGAFDEAVKNLRSRGLFEAIERRVLDDGVPILGICLGMQLLTKGSEEGRMEGFGFVDAYAKRFDFSQMQDPLPIPHMGWNVLHHQRETPLFSHMPPHERFYFVHSYAVECEDMGDVLTTTSYGYEFVSSFGRGNVVGCQFHPEKSHRFGMRLLENFVEEYPC
jgi:glutamine amidotransferase